jgi:hypothetical protein
MKEQVFFTLLFLGEEVLVIFVDHPILKRKDKIKVWDAVMHWGDIKIH